MLARQLGKEGILRCVSLYRNSKHRQPPSSGHSEQTLTAYEQVFQKVDQFSSFPSAQTDKMYVRPVPNCIHRDQKRESRSG